MTAFPDPLVLKTNADWKDVLALFQDDVEWPIPAGTPIQMQIREKACSPFVDLELSTANGRLIITEEGWLAFNVPAATLSSRLAPIDCDDRSFEADIVATIEERQVLVVSFGVTVQHGVTK